MRRGALGAFGLPGHARLCSYPPPPTTPTNPSTPPPPPLVVALPPDAPLAPPALTSVLTVDGGGGGGDGVLAAAAAEDFLLSDILPVRPTRAAPAHSQAPAPLPRRGGGETCASSGCGNVIRTVVKSRIV